VSLRKFNQILQQHQLERAESSFQISEEEATHAQAVAQQQDGSIPNLGNFVVLHFPVDKDTESIAQELAQLSEVERAVAVPIAIPPDTPLNEPLVGNTDQVVLDPVSNLENQWYIFRCQANQAWNTASGKDVVIADIDWGYRTSHQDLASRLDLNHAYNAYDGGTNVSTGNSIYHGTGVMGIAGGADNNVGMAGFAFGATLWPVQANSGPGTGLGGNSWARAIEWVRTSDSGGKRKVIILEVQTGSYGNYEMVPSVNAAIRTAIAHNVVVCVAAGNGNRDAGIDDSGNPIPETGSVLVGATEYHTTQNRRAGFSNFGSQIVVCAPGDGSHDLTCNSSSDSAYRNGFGGTSGATPKVAGTVALMLEVDPDLTPADIRTLLNTTGTPVVTDAGKPVGTFLNTKAAVKGAMPVKIIGIQATCNNKYVCAEDAGNKSLIANRDWIRGWETFKLIDLGSGKVAMQAVNGKYVCAEEGGNKPLIANRDWIRGWETFEYIDKGNSKFALKAWNGKYVCAEEAGNKPLIANRDWIRGWETFSLILI
jgi:subtilisin family serine protease